MKRFALATLVVLTAATSTFAGPKRADNFQIGGNRRAAVRKNKAIRPAITPRLYRMAHEHGERFNMEDGRINWPEYLTSRYRERTVEIDWQVFEWRFFFGGKKRVTRPDGSVKYVSTAADTEMKIAILALRAAMIDDLRASRIAGDSDYTDARKLLEAIELITSRPANDYAVNGKQLYIVQR